MAIPPLVCARSFARGRRTEARAKTLWSTERGQQGMFEKKTPMNGNVCAIVDRRRNQRSEQATNRATNIE
jgi:hypothetical protein